MQVTMMMMEHRHRSQRQVAAALQPSSSSSSSSSLLQRQQRRGVTAPAAAAAAAGAAAVVVVAPVDPIVQMNNLGCAYIRQEKYDDAIRTFSNALSILRTSIKKYQQQDQQEQGRRPAASAPRQQQEGAECNNEDDNDDVMMSEEDYRYDMFCQRVKVDYSSSYSVQSVTSTSTTTTTTTTTTRKVEEAYGYMYNRPVELKDVDHRRRCCCCCPMEEEHGDQVHVVDETSKLTRCHDSLVVMFNLALSYHLLAVDMVEHSAYYHHAATIGYETYLKQALSLYELSNAVMECEQMECGFHFIMCLTNNVGHCHNVLGDQIKATQCFEHLLSIQMYLIDRNRCSCNGGGQQEQQQEVDDEHSVTMIDDGFIQNTSRFVVLKNCSAHAA